MSKDDWDAVFELAQSEDLLKEVPKEKKAALTRAYVLLHFLLFVLLTSFSFTMQSEEETRADQD
jgi:hypothetical protein